MKSILHLSGILGVCTFLVGCETIQQEGFDQPAPIKHENSISGPAPIIETDSKSGPTKINLSGDLKLDLPEEVRNSFGAPQVKGHFSIKINADYIGESTGRSRYTSTLKLRITNLDGTKEYINLNTESDGEYDGSPNQGIGTAFEQILETIEIYGELLQQQAKQKQNNSDHVTD